MKMKWSDVRPRLGLVAIVLTCFLSYKSDVSWMWLIGPVGLLATVLAIMKLKRDVYVGTVTGWGYWLLAAWKGDAVRLYFHGVADAWGGDGSFLTTLCSLAVALVYVAIAWSTADRNMMEILHKLAPKIFVRGKRDESKPKDWETVTFILGEDMTEEKFRLGGE